ncbi:hypothetical protein EDD11_010443 [Mortierella claussenii]|nr:hypothetical protein EDD11_010443 [Mortierella claussenii]
MLSSPAMASWPDGQPSSASRIDESDLLTVEKSRVLEQLRHITTEVDQLESRLQAVKRRRARAAASALQKQQEAQEVEAQEVRNILGSVRHLSLSDGSKQSGPEKKAARSPLSSHSTSPIDIEMIRKLQGFTNIGFTSIQHRTLSATESGVRDRRYHIDGTCFQLEFEVEFTVHEPNLNLSNLHIQLPRSAQSELGKFVQKAQMESNLLPFFRTLVQYAQMDYDRQVLMTNLTNRFPQLIKSNRTLSKLSGSPQQGRHSAFTPASPSGPGVQSLIFCGRRKSAPELVFHWVIDVTDRGKVKPYVRLLPRMPKKWRLADDKATLDAIPTQFVRLLQLKGTEGAVAILLQCVYGRQAAGTMVDHIEQDDEEEAS